MPPVLPPVFPIVEKTQVRSSSHLESVAVAKRTLAASHCGEVFRGVECVEVCVAVLLIGSKSCLGDGVDEFARNAGLSSRDVVLEGSSRFGSSQKAKRALRLGRA